MRVLFMKYIVRHDASQTSWIQNYDVHCFLCSLNKFYYIKNHFLSILNSRFIYKDSYTPIM